MMTVLGIFLAIMAGRATAGPDGKDVPRVAFFGFEFINTSLEPTAQAELERIRLLDDVLRQKLAASERFEVVDIPPDTTKEIASGPAISNCNGCQPTPMSPGGGDSTICCAIICFASLDLSSCAIGACLSTSQATSCSIGIVIWAMPTRLRRS